MPLTDAQRTAEATVFEYLALSAMEKIGEYNSAQLNDCFSNANGDLMKEEMAESGDA